MSESPHIRLGHQVLGMSTVLEMESQTEKSEARKQETMQMCGVKRRVEISKSKVITNIGAMCQRFFFNLMSSAWGLDTKVYHFKV